MPKLPLAPIPEGRSVHPMFRQLDDMRIKRGMSVAELSEASGYHLSQFRDWRNGKHHPSLSAVADMAECVGLGLVLMDADIAEAIAKKRAGGA